MSTEHSSATYIPPDEVSRLEAEHKYIRKALNFTIHPQIETALWTTRKHNPDCVIRSIDISTIPQLVGHSHESTSERTSPLDHNSHELPSELHTLHSKPDYANSEVTNLISINQLHTALPSDQWDQTLSHLIRTLKPGGWIQWVDWDPSTLRIAGVRPGTPDATALRALLRRYTDALSARQAGTTYRIESTFKNEGLVEIDSDMYPIEPEVEFTRNVVEGVVRELEEWGVIAKDEAERLRTEVGEEVVRGGVLIWWDLWCHIGRKQSHD